MIKGDDTDDLCSTVAQKIDPDRGTQVSVTALRLVTLSIQVAYMCAPACRDGSSQPTSQRMFFQAFSQAARLGSVSRCKASDDLSEANLYGGFMMRLAHLNIWFSNGQGKFHRTVGSSGREWVPKEKHLGKRLPFRLGYIPKVLGSAALHQWVL